MRVCAQGNLRGLRHRGAAKCACEDTVNVYIFTYIYIYICACVCICIYIYIYIHIYICKYSSLYLQCLFVRRESCEAWDVGESRSAHARPLCHKYVYTYISTYLHMYIYICVCVCVYIYISIYIYKYIYVSIYICLFVRRERCSAWDVGEPRSAHARPFCRHGGMQRLSAILGPIAKRSP